MEYELIFYTKNKNIIFNPTVNIYMEIPPDKKVMEIGASIFWFGEEGILYSISKKTEPQSLEEAKKLVSEFKQVLGGRKVCMLVDVTNTSESTREVRDYAAQEFPTFIKAIAMISRSALGKMLANLFFTVKSQPYPTKMFNSETEAREWLKQYV